MAYWVKRIILKSGEVVKENELLQSDNTFQGLPPVVGEKITVRCRGRSFLAEVYMG